MIKKPVVNSTDRKERLKAAAKDRIYRFLMGGGSVRGAMIRAGWMIRQMRTNHELGLLETLALGHAYMAAALVSAEGKAVHRSVLQMNCTGPIQGLQVEATANGQVRGFLKTSGIALDQPPGSFDLAPFFGGGTLSVTRYLKDGRWPFTGTVAMRFGTVAKDLAHYYRISEQTPAAFHLSIQFDPDGEVAGAGGLFVQTLPGTDTETTVRLESLVEALPSLGKVFAGSGDPETLIHDWFGTLSPKILDRRRAEFVCHCSKTRTRNLLTMLPAGELEEIAQNGPFPLEMKCHNCGTRYHFTREELRRIRKRRFSRN
ncbi:MAG: Hsp33 family molecular chaperone HslO [Desulfobacteraceae bacterium]|jgi:molecular chaperone Hsp33|nr:Hsp33 family molecular chaperone HslO [Desulfobacteraceae bacterium]